jgi:phosphoglycerate dehydrogenase-like enzyme
LINLLTTHPSWERLLATTPLTDVCQPVLLGETGFSAQRDLVTIAYAGPDVAMTGISHFLTSLIEERRLQWLQTCAAGVEHPLYGALARTGVRVSNSHATSSAIAEYVLSTVLDHFQRGPERRSAAAAREWRRLFYRELRDTHWLVIGLGAVGRDVAVRARAFGARVTAVRHRATVDRDADQVIAYTDLLDYVADADVIVVSTALAESTHKLIGREFLARLSPGKTVLVNVARGEILDEDALAQSLRHGQPEFACLDVFTSEPLPVDSWLWSDPRVTVTAHAAALGSGVVARTDALFLRNLGRFTAGDTLLNDVTVSLGGSVSRTESRNRERTN